MNKIILLLCSVLLVNCDNSEPKIYLPNTDITFNNKYMYYDNKPFTGTVVGYNVDNNPECPDEITVDFVNGLIQGRAQAITLEDIDVSYQVNSSKLNGWSTIFIYRLLYNNDKIMDCKAADEVVAGIKYDATEICSDILSQDDVSPPDLYKTTGESVINTFYSLLQDINQRNFTRKDLDGYCYEVYEYGWQFFKHNQ